MSYLKDVVIISTLPYNKLASFTEMDVLLKTASLCPRLLKMGNLYIITEEVK